MHKLIIGSTCSTTLQNSATLHKLLPVHPTGQVTVISVLCVHIFDVGELTQVVNSN